MIRSSASRSIRQYRPTRSLPQTLPHSPLNQHQLQCLNSSKRTLFTTTTRPTVGTKVRSFAVRVGLAVAFVYWYNTSTIFAEEPADKQPHISRAPPVEPVPEEHLPTIDEITAARKHQLSSMQATAGTAEPTPTEKVLTEPRSPESLEEEAGQQGAFNEETGEINWDCPCLGGMAHGPCGEEFREAFTCFVFSKEEPKGVECIEKFKGMQNCFQKFPEIYGEPPSDDEEEEQIDRALDALEPASNDEKGKTSTTDSDKPSDTRTPPIAKPGTSKPDSSKPPPSSKPTPAPPSSDLSRPPPADKGTDEYSHPPPQDNTGSKPGQLGHPSPGEKGVPGIGGSEGPVDTDASTTGLSRPTPSGGATVGGHVGGHGAPGVKGVSDPTHPNL